MLNTQISNGNRIEWSPIQSIIIATDEQNWMSAERESNLFSGFIMITIRIGRHEVLLQVCLYIKIKISENERKNKQRHRILFEKQLLLSQILSVLFWPISQRFNAAIQSNYFLFC